MKSTIGVQASHDPRLSDIVRVENRAPPVPFVLFDHCKLEPMETLPVDGDGQGVCVERNRAIQVDNGNIKPPDHFAG